MLDFGTQIKVCDFYFTIGISNCVFCVCDLVNYAIFMAVAWSAQDVQENTEGLVFLRVASS